MQVHDPGEENMHGDGVELMAMKSQPTCEMHAWNDELNETGNTAHRTILFRKNNIPFEIDTRALTLDKDNLLRQRK